MNRIWRNRLHVCESLPLSTWVGRGRVMEVGWAKWHCYRCCVWNGVSQCGHSLVLMRSAMLLRVSLVNLA